MSKRIILKNNSARRKLVKLLLIGLMLVIFARITVLISHYYFWKTELAIRQASDRILFRVMYVDIFSSLLQALVIISTIVVLSRWLYQSYSNLAKFQFSPLSYHAHLAYWFWLIPFYNYYVSHQMITETFTWYEQILISEKRIEHSRFTRSIITFCWACICIGTLLFVIGFLPNLSGISITILSNVFFLVSTLLLMRVLSTIGKLEKAVLMMNDVVLYEKLHDELID